jgi:hypothetical protein
VGDARWEGDLGIVDLGRAADAEMLACLDHPNSVSARRGEELK